MGITLLTINTWKCDGDYHGRMEALANGIAESGAQVVLCQECFKTIDGKVDTLARLSAALGMTASFVACRRKMRSLENKWVDSYSGLGVLTALPISAAAAVDLPSNLTDGGRKAQWVTLEISPGYSILLVNIHLTHLRDEDLRRQQLKTVLKETLAGVAGIRIIGGDWNTPVGSPVLRELMEEAPAADCYILGGGEEPRATLLSPFREGHYHCVDHFFSLPLSGRTTYPRYTGAGIVLNGPCGTNGLYPSDHFGIRVTLLPD
jgi:endonuclease/exonuclease/phosphatase family metal-dependent hydrolase